jgi:hypothetical protein
MLANWTRQFGIRQTGNRQFGMLPPHHGFTDNFYYERNSTPILKVFKSKINLKIGRVFRLNYNIPVYL